MICALIKQLQEYEFKPAQVLINPKDRFKFIPYKIGKYRRLKIKKLQRKIKN